MNAVEQAEAWNLVNDWRNDDADAPLPDTDYALDLAHAIDVLLAERKPDTEPCTYCGESFPFPVELHHDEVECQRTREVDANMLAVFLSTGAMRSRTAESCVDVANAILARFEVRER